MAPKKKDKERSNFENSDVKSHEARITVNGECSKLQDVKNGINTDRNNLLKAVPLSYTRICQAYRMCSNRQKTRPLFLFRNLSYMTERMSRNHQRRKTFRVDEILPKLEAKLGLPSKLTKYLTLTFLGFYDPKRPSNKNTTVRVETFIEKTLIRRRDVVIPTKAQVGTNEVPLNPERNDGRPVPILSISPENMNVANSAVKVRRLLLRVVGDGLSEPFEAKYNVFNSCGQCVMTTAKYDSGPDTDPGSHLWIDLPGNLPFANPKISFKVEWTSDCKSGWVPRPQSEEEERAGVCDMDEPPPPPKATPSLPAVEVPEYVVAYNFQWANYHLDTIADPPLKCPYCNLISKKIYTLMKHLKLCHERFQFQFSPQPAEIEPKRQVVGSIPAGAKVELKDQHLQVDVTMNDAPDVSHEGNPYHLAVPPQRDVVARRTVFTIVQVCRPKRHKPSLAEFLEPEDAVDFEAHRPTPYGHNRLYYHATTCMPVHAGEMEYDSEGERDPSWLKNKTIMMIDDFTDVNEGEKEIIKLWNLHALKYGFVGDCQIFLAIQMFIREQGSQIIRRNLVRNFQLHMSNLFEYGLLNPPQVYEAMRLLREKMRDDVQGRQAFGQAWLDGRLAWLASGGAGGPRDKASTAPPAYEPTDGHSDPKQNQSSTFISGDGTLRRKMAGAPRGRKGRPPASSSSKAVLDDSDDDKLLSVRRHSLSDPPSKKSVSGPDDAYSKANGDRSLRKRKLSLQDRISSGRPTKRARAGSDPQRRKLAGGESKPSTSTEASKPTMRKSVAP